MQWNIDQNKNVFIHENAFEIVVCQNGCHFVKGGDELNEPLPYVIPDYVRTNKVNINNGVLFPVLQSHRRPWYRPYAFWFVDVCYNRKCQDYVYIKWKYWSIM